MRISMSFVLTVDDKNREGNSAVIENPTPADIDKAICVLKQDPLNFLVLESDPPIDAFIFIQATNFSDGVFRIEAEYKEGNALHVYYCDARSEAELSAMLLNFISDIVPDISDWEYYGDFGTYGFYKEYGLRKFLKENGLIAFKSENVPKNTVRIESGDIQLFLKYVKENNIKTVFYRYGYADKDAFSISNLRNGVDNDLLRIAEKEINVYADGVKNINFDRASSLVLFCIDNGVIVSMRIVAPWLREIVSPSDFFEFLKKEHGEELAKVKSHRNNEKDGILAELRTRLLSDPDFVLCANRDLRREFMRKFLAVKENEHYRLAFLDDNGYLDSYGAWDFANMTYAFYKQHKKK